MNSFSSLNELFGSITYYQILSSNNGYFFLFCKLSDNFTHVIFDKISLISPIILFRISYSYIQLSIFNFNKPYFPTHINLLIYMVFSSLCLPKSFNQLFNFLSDSKRISLTRNLIYIIELYHQFRLCCLPCYYIYTQNNILKHFPGYFLVFL